MSGGSAYEGLRTLGRAAGAPVSPAEIQGFLWGRCTAGAGFDPGVWLTDLAEYLDVTPDEALQRALLGLLGMAREELGAGELGTSLLLPDDDAPLADRVQALAEWCQGFLSGYGLYIGSQASNAEDTREMLADLTAIARAEAAEADSEAAEADYAEVVEYVRMLPHALRVTPAAPAAASGTLQ